MTTRQSRAPKAAPPTADVFARNVQLLVEKHYFGETKSASMAPVRIAGEDGELLSAEDQARTKAFTTLTKRLINSEELRRIRYRDIAFRDFLKGSATPFRPGLWLVPFGVVERVDAEAEAWESDRQALVDAAALAYPAHVQAMREPLGPLYDPRNYPPVEVFKSKFWVDWRYIDFGVSGILREVRADIFRRETEKMQRQALEARAMIDQHLTTSLLDITTHLRGTLAPKASGKRASLRAGCFDKLLGFLDTVDKRDPSEGLTKVVAQLRKLGGSMDLETLRDDEHLRDQIATEMAAVTEALEAMVEESPSRGIRVRDEEVA